MGNDQKKNEANVKDLNTLPNTPLVSTSRDTPVSHNQPNPTPKVTIFGCGGCGINIVSKYLNANSDTHFSARYIDLSVSNKPVGSNVPFDLIELPNGQGSGKNRALNGGLIMEKVPAIAHSVKSDIAIIVASLSGGSGSTVAASMIKALKQQGKGVLFFGVVDSSDQVGAINSAKTFMSLQGLSRSINKPFYVSLYDNSQTQTTVDNDILERLNVLEEVLCDGYVHAIDFRDRMNFVSPEEVTEIPAGVYGFKVKAGPDWNACHTFDESSEFAKTDTSKDIVPSVYFVSDGSITLQQKSRVKFTGTREHKRIVFAVNGITIDDKKLRELNNSIEQYQQAKTKSTEFEFSVGCSSNDDMVL